MNREQYKRVLVVDDDPGVRNLLASVLRQQSLEVDEAEDGNVAIDYLRDHQYSVVLLDLLMPRADGFAVLDALHSATLPNSTPVVLVLTGADRRVIEQLDAQRIHGIVKKPFDPVEIGALVVACTEIRSRSSFETMAVATMLGTAPLLAIIAPKLQ